MTQQELQVVASKLRKYGGTLLHIKIEENEVEAARVLIRGCALMNCKDMNGRTPLHLAAAKGFSNILVDLVSEGAKLNCKDKDDRTPLMLAAISKHYDCMRLLLRSGAQTDLKDKNGNTAFFYSSFPQINITCTNFGCTSSSSFLQETRKQGSLEQGLSFQPPHKSDVISIYFNRESLSEESVDIPYEVIPKKASYRLPLNFDFTINLDPSPFCKVTLKSTFTKNKFGKLNLVKEPQSP